MKEFAFNIKEFAEYASMGTWKPFIHLTLVCYLLMLVVEGKISRLMIFMPPRHGKSELISYYFLTWFLGNFPDKNVILTTHSANFSRKWGRRVRNLLDFIGEHAFGKPIKLAEDSQAAHSWNIKDHSGGLVTAGVGGSILGEGADGFIIDDPTKGFKKARSKTHQKELNDWWYTEAKTRLNAGIEDGSKPWVIGIWQRLNINDLAGQILYKTEGDKRVPNEPHMDFKEAIEILRNGGSIPYGTWVILNLPAIAMENDSLGRQVGEPLWPEQKPLEELQQIKREMGSFRFNAVYQGEPREPEGNVFYRKWFAKSKVPDKEMDKMIEKLPSLRYWDLGASGEDGDPTAANLSYWDGEYLYLRKQLNRKLTAKGVLDYFKDICIRDGLKTRVFVEQEPGASPKVLIRTLQHLPGLSRHMIRPDNVAHAGDKLTRSFDLQALAENGKVLIAESIFDMIVDELVEFTGEEGGMDNITDTCTGAARYWTRNRPKINV
ncbi:MAG: terminase large subunit [Methanobrevibacter sp.]|uniref:terminase large subunit n=1 Tax=Methanobrevibacter sp. TaxID=66852 RepID=UPI0025E35FA2|nr:terminase large subunit [Methanobrevibacter sp.]MBE6508242.1 terminase large subunit [Methanobrevibacter sp.]